MFMKLTWLSHACFEIKNEKTILIDPFFKGNDLAPKYENNPDIILVTHEHYDHADISGFNSTIVSTPSFNSEDYVKMKIGEVKEIDGVKIVMVEASHHQSQYASGFIIEIHEKRIYHPGDTYLEAIKNRGDIDIFLVPIGGHYTMNTEEALEALKIVKPKLAIPMHFNTFDKIKADPNEFKEKAEKLGFNVQILEIGHSIEI